MEKQMSDESTLTSVLAKSQIQLRIAGASSSSIARNIPYWETYRDSAAHLEETPVERIQRIAGEGSS
jgi:hypothetical protein